jgi:hypothetical protein
LSYRIEKNRVVTHCDINGNPVETDNYDLIFEGFNMESDSTGIEVRIPLGNPAHFATQDYILKLVDDLKKLLIDNAPK